MMATACVKCETIINNSLTTGHCCSCLKLLSHQSPGNHVVAEESRPVEKTDSDVAELRRTSSLLTIEEARTFLKDVLRLEDDDVIAAVNGMKKERLDFLNRIILAIYHATPFQSISLLSMDPDTRHVPTWLEIKDAMFTKQGGLCLVLNAFLHELLLALGFEVYIAYSLDYFDINCDHIVVIAENVSAPGDRYLVDVGFGYPIFEALSLDFDGDHSPAYEMSYWTIRLARDRGEDDCDRGEDGCDRFVVESYDGGIEERRTLQNVEFIEDMIIPQNARWLEEFTFQTRPYSLEEFLKKMHSLYCEPSDSYFLNNLHAVMFKNQVAFAFKNSALLLEDDSGNLKAEVLTSDERLRDRILEYFPQFTSQTVNAALRNLRSNQKQFPHLNAAKIKHRIE
ncbi:uncharacterized protein LOC141908729 [Tubulanus polymorphus]|uniref:uncharacterized protein LOC141908729 n=1 Tax=Tubulanus polymorphus TaxID=672921 RepID=UPI003DA4E76A